MCCIPILPFPAMSLPDHAAMAVKWSIQIIALAARRLGQSASWSVSRTPSRAYDFRSGERADALSFLSQNNSLELTRLRFKRAAVIASDTSEKSQTAGSNVFLRNSTSATIARGVAAGTGNRPRSVGARARARGGVGRRSLSRDSRSRPAQLSAPLCPYEQRTHIFSYSHMIGAETRRALTASSQAEY